MSARPPRVPPAESEARQGWILALLRERGPLFAAEMVEPLALSINVICRYLQLAHAAGQIANQIVRRGQNHLALWRFVSAVPTRTPPTKAHNAAAGITAEDLEWMAYWRQHAAARCHQRQERRHAG